MSERGSIIYLEGVVVDYDGFKALNNLNFIVNYNDIFDIRDFVEKLTEVAAILLAKYNILLPLQLDRGIQYLTEVARCGGKTRGFEPPEVLAQQINAVVEQVHDKVVPVV